MLTGAGGLVGVSARWWASLHAGGLVTCPMTVPWRGSDLLLYLFFIIFCFFKKKQKSGIWGKSQFYEYWQWSFKILKHCRPKQTRFMGLIEWTGCHFQPWYKPLVWEIKSWKSNIKREQVQKDRHFLGPSPGQAGAPLHRVVGGVPREQKVMWILTSPSGLENFSLSCWEGCLLTAFSHQPSLETGLPQESCLAQRPSPVSGPPASHEPSCPDRPAQLWSPHRVAWGLHWNCIVARLLPLLHLALPFPSALDPKDTSCRLISSSAPASPGTWSVTLGSSLCLLPVSQVSVF